MTNQIWRRKANAVVAVILSLVLCFEALQWISPWVAHAIETTEASAWAFVAKTASKQSTVEQNYTVVNQGIEGTDDSETLKVHRNSIWWDADLASPQYNVNPRERYTLSFEYQIRNFAKRSADPGVEELSLEAYVEQYDANNALISKVNLFNEPVKLAMDNIEEWTKYPIYAFETAENASYCKVYLGLHTPNASGAYSKAQVEYDFYVNQVKLESKWQFVAKNPSNNSALTAVKNNYTVSYQGVEGAYEPETIKLHRNATWWDADLVASEYNVNPQERYSLSFEYQIRNFTKTSADPGVDKLSLEAYVEQYDANNVLISKVNLFNQPVKLAMDNIEVWTTYPVYAFETAENVSYCKLYFGVLTPNANGAYSKANVGYDFYVKNATLKSENTWQLAAKNSNQQSTVEQNYTISYQGVEGTDETGTIKLHRNSIWWDADMVSPQYNINPRERYTLSFEYQIRNFAKRAADPGVEELSLEAYVEQYDANNALISKMNLFNQPVKLAMDNIEEWGQYPTYAFETAENASYCKVYLGMHTPNASGAYSKAQVEYDFYVNQVEVMLQKSVLFVGDEIAAGMAEVATISNKMKVTDACVVGSGFSASLSATIKNQIHEYGMETYDFIVISGGLNDVAANVLAGEVTDNNSYMDGNFDTATFAGALEDAFRTVAEHFDDIRVVFVFPNGDNMATYREVARQASEKWGIEFVDIDVDTDENNWNEVNERLEEAVVFDRDLIPGVSIEKILAKQYNRLVEGGITPATNVEALQRILIQAQEANFPDLEEAIENAVEQYELYRATLCGATIAKDDANQLRFIAVSPVNVLPEGVAVKKMGILTLSADCMMPGTANYNNDAVLEVGNEFVTDITTTYTTPTAVYDGILSGSAVDPAKEYAAIAYVIYEVEGKECVLYSANNYWNDIGKQSVVDGVTKKSVYAIAQEMALILVENQEGQLNYDAIGGKINVSQITMATEKTEVSLYDVFCMVSDNSKLLNEALRVGGAF